jgi:NADPH:quinone reductase-like Zn-dependent oxidoreductase
VTMILFARLDEAMGVGDFGHGTVEVVATAEQDIVAVVRRLTDDKGAHLVFDPVGGTAFPQLARCAAARHRSPLQVGDADPT